MSKGKTLAEREDTLNLDHDKIRRDQVESRRKIALVQRAIRKTFPELNSHSSVMSVWRAIDEFRGDPEPLLAACKGLGEKSLDRLTPANALKYIISVAKNAKGAVKYSHAKKVHDDPELDKLERELRYYTQDFLQDAYADQIYPTLEVLSEKLGKSIEELYSEREYLPAGELQRFKDAWEKVSGPEEDLARFPFLNQE